WQDRGYFKMLVSGRAEPQGSGADDQHFLVRLHVEEGSQYRLGSIVFQAVSDVIPNDTQVEHDSGPTDSEDKPTLRKVRKTGDPEPYRLPVFPIEELRSL